jgi:hypothetical protein
LPVYKVTGRAAAPLSGLFPESLSSYVGGL